MGADLSLDAVPTEEELATDTLLFAESNGRFVVTIAADDRDRFERHFEGQPFARLGTVTELPRLIARRGTHEVFNLSIDELKRRYKETLANA